MNAPVEAVEVDPAIGAGWEVAAATSIGNVRTENQDRVAAVALRDDGLALLVADGMGGMPRGGEAATVATAVATARLRGAAATTADALEALMDANAAVGRLRDRLAGQPGTTMTLALLAAEGGVAIAHAGDTRAYVISGTVARPVTEDHSWAGLEVRRGALPPGSERRDPRRNQVTVALLGDPIQPQVTSVAVRAGEVVMICSDGFWEPVLEEQTRELLGGGSALAPSVAAAVEAALEAGSRDNVSLIAARRRF
ncbi:MAG: PP2C family protein-serine/threonine phosphatase [Candidatus Dormibacteria bacterium]